jgi:predicted amidophosphoribosyltransferase
MEPVVSCGNAGEVPGWRGTCRGTLVQWAGPGSAPSLRPTLTEHLTMFLPPRPQRPHRPRRFRIVETIASRIGHNYGRSCCVLMREGGKATAAWVRWWASC